MSWHGRLARDDFPSRSDLPFTGTAQVTYSIQAVRSTAAGQFAEFVVNFGAGGLVSPQAVPVKLAA